MTPDQRKDWTSKLAALEDRITKMKNEAIAELHQTVGCHTLVHGLAAIESLTWGLRDATERYPVEDRPCPGPDKT